MATRKKKEQDPSSVVKGSHLTVTTLSDGRTVLEWDDEALLRDVQKALTEYENSVKVNTRATKVKKTKK
jgi:predicted metal-dependent hydrolase